ncbi:MAG: TIGR02679 family protein [Actinomycetota bacterium]
MTLSNPSEEERLTCARLLGIPVSNARVLTVSLKSLDSALRSSRFGIDLRNSLELSGEPLIDRRAEREAMRERKEAEWVALSGHRAASVHPELVEWMERVRATGLLARLDAGNSQLFSQALDALALLPTDGLALRVLAARVSGDAHSLDIGRPLATLVLHGIAHLHRRSLPQGSLARRRLWARAGVVCDELSCDVLVYGLHMTGDETARALDALTVAGEPVRLTLRQLERTRPRFAAASLLVCENPVVVAEVADRLGPEGPPLVCTDGVPNTAVMAVLNSLAEQGAVLEFHTDFDWGGLRIGNLLASRVGAAPWRLGASDYLEAVEALEVTVPLTGPPVEASWDRSLQEAMVARSAAVYEEQVIEAMLENLT